MSTRSLIIASVLATLQAVPVIASPCETLAAQVGHAFGLPEGLLPAISRKESGYAPDGGARQGWPWALNEGGRSSYFDGREEAEAYLLKAVARGVRNIDVGCMQINYRWHSDSFASPAQMLDPETNVRYAAQFLSDLKERSRTWDGAVAKYHSSNNQRGSRYARDVMRIAAQINSAAPDQVSQVVSRSDTNPSSMGLFDRQSIALVPLPASSSARTDMKTIPVQNQAGTPPVQSPLILSEELLERGVVPLHLSANWEEVMKIREKLGLTTN